MCLRLQHSKAEPGEPDGQGHLQLNQQVQVQPRMPAAITAGKQMVNVFISLMIVSVSLCVTAVFYSSLMKHQECIRRSGIIIIFLLQKHLAGFVLVQFTGSSSQSW